MTLSHRFVICVDVDGASLEDAYSKLYDSMAKISNPSLEWESTDEAYDSDGKTIDPAVLQNARAIKLNEVL